MSPLISGLILLAATALVSGLLAPYIVNKIQVANQQRLKRYEVDLARQSKIIEEQEALIRRISGLLWEYQLALIAPFYYSQPQFRYSQRAVQSESNLYGKAAEYYLANVVRILGSIRGEIGAAVRLVPAEQSNDLKKLYSKLLSLDVEVTKLILAGRTEDNEDKWSVQHDYILNDFALILDETIDGLAIALDLKYKPAHLDGELTSRRTGVDTRLARIQRSQTDPLDAN
jgi:hypothetical protein